KTVLAAADWSNYTAGDDGLLIRNIFPGIDAEMKVRRGAIKTNFIIRRNQFPDVKKFVFEDHFNANQNTGKLTCAATNGHQKATFLINHKASLNINRAIAYIEKNAAENYQYLDYSIADNKLSFSLDAVFIDKNLPSGNVIIDPLVEGTATLAQNAITGSMNCGSATNYCGYNFIVPAPPKATLTNISFKWGFYAYAPSGENQGFFILKSGNYTTGSIGVVNPTINTQPGSVSTMGNFNVITSLIPALPPPSCQSQNMPIELRFYNIYCGAGTGCSDTYVASDQPLIIKIEGHTLEANTITSPVAICSGSSTILNVTAQYGVPPYAYKWNTGATTASITVSPTATTAYAVVITDQCGNTVTQNTSVTVNPIPVIASVSSNSPLCTGSQLNLSVPIVTGATYSWTGPDNFTSKNSNPTLANVTAAQSGTYTVTETVNGCTSVPLSVNVEIGVPSTPTISITASATTVCAGTNVTFTATPVNGGNNPVYQWKLNGVNVGTNSITYSNNTLKDNDLLTCILTSSAACTTTPAATSNSIVVKVNPVTVPSVSISASTSTGICAGTSVGFTATAVNGGVAPSYQWLLNGNKVGSDAANYTNNTLNNLDEVSCILTSNAVCTTSPTATSNLIKFSVTPLVAPDINITASAMAICPGTKITFNAIPVNGGGNPIYQWKLNNTDVGTNSNVYENSALKNNDVITCTIKSDITCVTTAFATSKSITITVNMPVMPAVVISASATNICAGIAVNFTATPVNGGNNPVYQWKLNGINSGTNSAYYRISAPNNGDVVSCILISDAPCSTTNSAISNTINMVVRPVLVPAVSIVASANNICSGTPVIFTASVVNAGNSPVFSWMQNGSPVGTNNTVFTSNILVDGDVITCVVTPDNSGCFTTTNVVSNRIVIKVNPIPVVSAGRDTTVFKGANFSLNGFATGSNLQYQWSPATYLSNTNILNPIITPLLTTKYTLRVINAAGCEATAQVTVKVFTKIVIPNTFTPNADGINDTWNIAGLADYPGATIDVYNRYGQQVFRTAIYKQWDGTYNGKPLPLSTYYYVINPKNNMALLSGWVAIIK
ncbi:MAG: T9SS type B sorting domain-containing protein, partial [Sphingobacteriaceae bacterium]